MNKNDIAFVTVRGFALILLVTSAMATFVGVLHILELQYFFPWSLEAAYRTSYMAITLVGEIAGVVIALFLLHKSTSVAAWLSKSCCHKETELAEPADLPLKN